MTICVSSATSPSCPLSTVVSQKKDGSLDQEIKPSLHLSVFRHHFWKCSTFYHVIVFTENSKNSLKIGRRKLCSDLWSRSQTNQHYGPKFNGSKTSLFMIYRLISFNVKLVLVYQAC